MVVEVAGDGFNKREGAADRVGGELEFAIDVTEDKDEGFLNFVEIGSGKEFVEREVFHELVVLVD